MYGLAMVLMERGMKDKAVAKLQEILKLDPGFCDAHPSCSGTPSSTTARSTRRSPNSPTSSSATRPATTPRSASAWRTRKKAIRTRRSKYFQSALKLNPKPEKVYYEMGKAYEKKGDLAQAIESYKHALTRLFGKQ